MSKVYIVNKGVHDYSDARRFGELVFLSEGAMNKYEISNMVREFAVIDQGQQLLSSVTVAPLNAIEDLGDLAHKRSVTSGDRVSNPEWGRPLSPPYTFSAG